MPEFVIAQEMSVEKIALHLEEKERAGFSSPLPDKSPPSRPNFFPIIAILLFGVMALTLGFFLGQPAKILPGWLQFGSQGSTDFVFARQYRAEVEITTGTRHEIEMIYMDNGKTRMEIESREAAGYTIIRPDTNKLYYIMPDIQSLYERDYAPEGVDRSMIGIPVNYMRMGPETMNGIDCIKYIVTVDGNPYYLWADVVKQVPVKTTSCSGDATTEYKSYQPGPQDASLFEPPAGYSRMESDPNVPRLVPVKPDK